jgi:hypothetical protein
VRHCASGPALWLNLQRDVDLWRQGRRLVEGDRAHPDAPQRRGRLPLILRRRAQSGWFVISSPGRAVNTSAGALPCAVMDTPRRAPRRFVILGKSVMRAAGSGACVKSRPVVSVGGSGRLGACARPRIASRSRGVQRPTHLCPSCSELSALAPFFSLRN